MRVRAKSVAIPGVVVRDGNTEGNPGQTRASGSRRNIGGLRNQYHSTLLRTQYFCEQRRFATIGEFAMRNIGWFSSSSFIGVGCILLSLANYGLPGNPREICSESGVSIDPSTAAKIYGGTPLDCMKSVFRTVCGPTPLPVCCDSSGECLSLIQTPLGTYHDGCTEEEKWTVEETTNPSLANWQPKVGFCTGNARQIYCNGEDQCDDTSDCFLLYSEVRTCASDADPLNATWKDRELCTLQQ